MSPAIHEVRLSGASDRLTRSSLAGIGTRKEPMGAYSAPLPSSPVMKLLPGPGRYNYMYLSQYVPLFERPRQCSGQDHDGKLGEIILLLH